MSDQDFFKAAFTRRDWSRHALALALAPWSLPTAQAQPAGSADAAKGPRWQVDPFALGVASGQPRPDSVVLWTRLLIAEADAAHKAQPQSVLCEVFADEALRQPVRQWRVQTDASRAHSVHVIATGLQPGRSYWYRFVSGSASSPVGRTRTSPGDHDKVAQLRIAQTSCQHFEQGYFVAHREIAKRHVGGVPQTLDDYRQRHAQYKGDADLQACHAAHPWVMTWDDHEVVNDYANDQDMKFTDPQVFLRRRATAYQAYFEHMPVRLGPDPTQPHLMRIHDQMRWGQLADIWTLDCRQYRSHHACPDPNRGGGRVVVGCTELQDAERSMLGAAQEQWLYPSLAQSTRRWKLLAQSTQMSSSGIATPLGRSSFTDGWDGYPVARERLLNTIAQARLQDVLVLGGDVHMNVAANLRVRPNDDKSPIVASEIVTTSISSRGMSETLLAQIRDNNPDIVHARADERGYTHVEVQPSGVLAQMRTTPHPAMEGSRLQTQAQWALASGMPGLIKA